MCGIAGFTGQSEHVVRNMIARLEHRGPDDAGVHVEPAISLGHRRLSIIDLSERGHQPMANEDGTVWIVFNGEIYNAPELRPQLEAKGHVFASRCDTEVIIHAYEEYGLDCVDLLQGMFAFAIWDASRARLVLARDRIGIKPLYYHVQDGLVAFASEIKALLEHPEVPRALDEQALFEYLGYEFVPAPRTLFRDIRKLQQGHLLIVEGGQVREQRYWKLDFDVRERSPEEESRAILELLDTAVDRRLLSDVPVGAFLSGGVDSSALVGLMRRHRDDAFDTYAIGYEDPTFSELPYAADVSRLFGTTHHVLMIDPLTPERIRKAVWHLDEPMTDLSSIPLMLISERARREVTVCLSGEGGDELFMGYDRFRASAFDRKLAFVPGPLRRFGYRLATLLPDQAQKKGAINILKRVAEGGLHPRVGGHMRWQYFLSTDLIQGLFASDLLERIDTRMFAPVERRALECSSSVRGDREVYVDLTLTMVDSILMKVDKMSMSTSLEVRVPFLDHEFVELTATIPASRKLDGFRTKAALRRAIADLLPPRITERGKQGYSIPIKNWLREDMREFMIDTITSSALVQKHLVADTLDRLIREHVSRRHNHNHVLWALINLAVWEDTFLRPRTAAGDGAAVNVTASTGA